jgi:hypothetical protein
VSWSPASSGPRAPTRLAFDPAAAEEALELAIQVGTSRAADQSGVNRATLYYAWKRFGLDDRPTGRCPAGPPAGPGRQGHPGADHPWRRDRSIWQRRTPDRTAERTAGHQR